MHLQQICCYGMLVTRNTQSNIPATGTSSTRSSDSGSGSGSGMLTLGCHNGVHAVVGEDGAGVNAPRTSQPALEEEKETEEQWGALVGQAAENSTHCALWNSRLTSVDH